MPPRGADAAEHAADAEAAHAGANRPTAKPQRRSWPDVASHHRRRVRAAAASRRRGAARRRVSRAALRPMLMLGGILVVTVGVRPWWITGGRFVSIDDAYVRAAKETVATDVSGIVAQVAVHEGQRVKKGDVLLRLDPRPFEIAVEAARPIWAGSSPISTRTKLNYQRMLRDVDAKAGAGAVRPGELRPLRQPGEARRRHPRRIRQRAVPAGGRPAVASRR